MIEIQIIGIRKPGGAYNTHSAITHYQWLDQTGKTGIWTRQEMIDWLLSDLNQHKAFVRDRQGDKAYCKVVKNQFGTIFLENYEDGTIANNLLNLPPC